MRGKPISDIAQFAAAVRKIKQGMSVPAVEIEMGLYEDAIRVYMRGKPHLRLSYKRAQEYRKRHSYAEAVICASSSGRLSRVKPPKGLRDEPLKRLDAGIIRNIVFIINKGISLNEACRKSGKSIQWLNRLLYASSAARAIFGARLDRSGRVALRPADPAAMAKARASYNRYPWTEACERRLDAYMRQHGMIDRTNFKRPF